MEVRPVNEGGEIQPRRVYVIPPDRDLTLENGSLRHTQFRPSSSPRAPINHFFRSLAEEQAELAIGIILSGMGADGSIGIQSIKGELQSANEELNSSKEELQSLNEELETVNSELQGKVQQVEKANYEMRNMLNSMDIPTIFLDNDLCIRRFSANAERVADLRQTDVGRPFKELSSKVPDVDLEEMIKQVLDTNDRLDREVYTTEAHSYLMRILPYSYLENQRRGVALIFLPIKAAKQTRERFQVIDDAWRFAEGIIETVRDPLLILDQNMKVITANQHFCRLFQVTREDVQGRRFYNLGDGRLGIPELRKLLEEVLPKQQNFEGVEIEYEFPEIGRKTIRLSARRFHESGVAKDRILLAMEV
jgi:two-component system CheB/CheR fusion protein